MRLILALPLAVAASLFAASLGFTLLYRFVDPPVTILMLSEWARGGSPSQQWLDLEEVPTSVRQAVVAAEDSNFCRHHGFDFEAIEAAIKRNARSSRLRGASTISQQTAKNVFLWPGRTWLRKGVEAYYTLLIETLWGKRRIAEVYLNVAELGPGIFGVQAAARHHFGRDASALTRTQAARLAAILPQPVKRSASDPGPYTRRYASTILARMRVVERDRLAACIGA
jgi:monofunctional biosynthetic peptidoglycan transglycosylase